MPAKILIVDDYPEIKEVIQFTLAEHDYEFITAKTGREALEQARAELPDLILLDVEMPGDWSGLEVCQRLKQSPRTNNTAIIILTAHGHKTSQEMAFKAGADAYICKPFSPLDLLAQVEKLLASFDM